MHYSPAIGASPTFAYVLSHPRAGRIAIEKKHLIALAIGTGATVLGGLILRYFDLLDDVAAWAWNVATTPITLPALLLVLLIAALVRLAWPHARKHVRRWRGLEEPAEVHLGGLEFKILSLYSGSGDERFSLETLRDTFPNTHPFRVERAMDALIDAGLVEEPSAGSSTYWLTSMGKDLCLEIEDDYQARRQERRSEDDNPAN